MVDTQFECSEPQLLVLVFIAGRQVIVLLHFNANEQKSTEYETRSISVH